MDDPLSPVVPVMLADTLVSWRGEQFNDKAAIIPTTVTSERIGQASNATLDRKVHIVTAAGAAAVAFAGQGELIRECLGTLRHRLPEWELEPRPMRQFGNNVNLYGRPSKDWPRAWTHRVEALGVYAPKSGPFNTMVRGPVFELPNLGLCGTIGKGDNDLEEMAREFYSDINPKANVYERIQSFAASITGIRLAKEIMGEAFNSWGGYIEYVYFDYTAWRWKRGPKTLHLFYVLDVTPNLDVGMVPRAIAYDPGEESGRVVALSAEASGVVVQTFASAN